MQELSVARLVFMCGWSPTFFVMKVGLSILYKVIACAPKRENQIGKNSWQVW